MYEPLKVMVFCHHMCHVQCQNTVISGGKEHRIRPRRGSRENIEGGFMCRPPTVKLAQNN